MEPQEYLPSADDYIHEPRYDNKGRMVAEQMHHDEKVTEILVYMRQMMDTIEKMGTAIESNPMLKTLLGG